MAVALDSRLSLSFSLPCLHGRAVRRPGYASPWIVCRRSIRSWSTTNGFNFAWRRVTAMRTSSEVEALRNSGSAPLRAPLRRKIPDGMKNSSSTEQHFHFAGLGPREQRCCFQIAKQLFACCCPTWKQMSSRSRTRSSAETTAVRIRRAGLKICSHRFAVPIVPTWNFEDPTPDDDPVRLRDWVVFELPSGAKHAAGNEYRSYGRESRVSSAIQGEVDLYGATFATSSGRRYVLAGRPGTTLDVDYVVNHWLAKMRLERRDIVDVSRALFKDVVETANLPPRPAAL